MSRELGHQSRRKLRPEKGAKAPKLRGLWIGLTGSLASGKSTACEQIQKEGLRILSSDAIVAQIYKKRGISKEDLKKAVKTQAGLKKLERWVHPLVKKEIFEFLKKGKMKTSVIEVPLLFEAGFEKIFDFTVVVFAPYEDRKKRATKRGMTAEAFDLLESRQISPEKKMAKADFILLNQNRKIFKKSCREFAIFIKTEGPALWQALHSKT